MMGSWSLALDAEVFGDEELRFPTRALNFCKWAGTLYDEIPKWFARLRVSREAMPLDPGEVILYC